MVSNINPLLVDEEREKTLLQTGLVFMIFAFLCWGMEFYFSGGYESKQASLPLNGGVFGPLIVTGPASTYKISLSQNAIALKVWNAVDIEVLDAEKNYLFSFGDEFWHESGYDEGNWDESKKNMQMKVHFEKAGVYFLSISAESNASFTTANNGYVLTVSRNRGSSLAFKWLRIFSLVLGGLCLIYRYREMLTESD